jgi:hypothetical protein
MSKGIAIQTILMLLVGILVVGIVVYMVYRYMFSPGMGIQECRGRVVSWCTSCAAVSWRGGITLSPDVAGCASQYFGYTVVNGIECNDHIGNNAATCNAATNCPNSTVCRAVGAGT